MSELNNENDLKEYNIELNDGKNKFVKKTIVFLLLFLVLCVGVTFFLIYQKENSNNIIDKVESNEYVIGKQRNNKRQVEVCEGLKAKDDTYKMNSLKIIEKSIEKDSKTTLDYFEIDGLKDLKLQQQINNRIKNTVLSMYKKEESKDEDIMFICINAIVEANYGNVMSIEINKSIDYIGDKTPSYLVETININLVNGDDLTFEELFLKDAPIKNILSQAVYESLIREIPFNEEEIFSSDLSKKDYSQVEDEMFLMMQYYNSQKNMKFIFTHNLIQVYMGQHLININMEEFYDQIAIYTRYKDKENIYNGKYDSSQEILVFTCEPDFSIYSYYNLKKVSDNLFVKIEIEKPEEKYSEVFAKDLENCKNNIIDKIEKYKNSSDGKARYIRAEITCSSNDWENRFEHNIHIQYYEYETSAEFFKTNFYPYILKQLQHIVYAYYDGFIFYDDFDSLMKKNVKEKVNEFKNLKYNPDTKKFEEVIEE